MGCDPSVLQFAGQRQHDLQHSQRHQFSHHLTPSPALENYPRSSWLGLFCRGLDCLQETAEVRIRYLYDKTSPNLPHHPPSSINKLNSLQTPYSQIWLSGGFSVLTYYYIYIFLKLLKHIIRSANPSAQSFLFRQGLFVFLFLLWILNSRVRKGFNI